MTRDHLMVGVLLAVVATGCGNSEATTTAAPTTTTIAVNSTEPDSTTTTQSGPQPLPAGGFLDPGEYVTTLFDPAVIYRIERNYILSPFQAPFVTGLQSGSMFSEGGVGPYRGVAVHSIWHGLTPDEVLARLQKMGAVELGPKTETEVGGFPGTAIDAVLIGRQVLYDRRGDGLYDMWPLEPPQMIRFIILDTPAGTLLITTQAAPEEWEDFLPIAEEILAGISFPDL